MTSPSEHIVQVHDTASHYADAHFPGLYSIVLGVNDNLLRRVFVARPGMLHSDLRSPDAPFLWHAHGYDFRETTIAGSVQNINAIPHEGGKRFNVYRTQAGMASGQLPRLWNVGAIRMACDDSTMYIEGESYKLDSSVIHRVVFHPSPATGWFACLVEETAKRVAPDVAYSTHDLDRFPNADRIYRKLSRREAQAVIDDLVEDNPGAAKLLGPSKVR